MDPNGDPYHEFNDWWSCYSLVYIGVPGPINNSQCAVENWYQSIDDALDGFDDSILAYAHTATFVIALKNKAEDYVKDFILDLAIKETGYAFDLDVLAYLELWDDPVNDQTLVLAFQTDTMDKGLLVIDDISERLKEDMHLSADGKFDKDNFKVAYNAVVLAKLSLLGSAGLNDLISRMGVSSTDVYPGVELYSTSENILFDSIRSIDGNHQWMPIAPPYPRKEGYIDIGWPELREYGYSSEDGIHGFRVWADEYARERFFRTVFKGPIAGALEYPSGFDSVIPASFPYKSCPAYPFPDGIGDDTCTAILLIPIISQFLMTK